MYADLTIFNELLYICAVVTKVLEERKKLQNKPPILVKIAPDLTKKDMEDIAAVVTRDKVCLNIDVVHILDGT